MVLHANTQRQTDRERETKADIEHIVYNEFNTNTRHTYFRIVCLFVIHELWNAGEAYWATLNGKCDECCSCYIVTNRIDTIAFVSPLHIITHKLIVSSFCLSWNETVNKTVYCSRRDMDKRYTRAKWTLAMLADLESSRLFVFINWVSSFNFCFELTSLCMNNKNYCHYCCYRSGFSCGIWQFEPIQLLLLGLIPHYSWSICLCNWIPNNDTRQYCHHRHSDTAIRTFESFIR